MMNDSYAAADECEYCVTMRSGWGGPGCCETCDGYAPHLTECTCPPHVAAAGELQQLLEELLPDHGLDVRHWPKDEQQMWRYGDYSSHEEKRATIRAYRFYKAALELGKRGYLKPSE